MGASSAPAAGAGPAEAQRGRAGLHQSPGQSYRKCAPRAAGWAAVPGRAQAARSRRPPRARGLSASGVSALPSRRLRWGCQRGRVERQSELQAVRASGGSPPPSAGL